MFILLVVKIFLLIYFVVLIIATLFVLYRIFKSQVSSFECGFTGVGAVMKLSLNFFFHFDCFYHFWSWDYFVDWNGDKSFY